MFVIRLAGVVLICACGLMVGMKKARDVFKKAELLRLMSLFLDDLYASIHYKKENAINLLCNLSREDKYKPLLLQFDLVEPPLWPKARQEAIEHSQNNLGIYINNSEYDLFKEAICSLGQDTAERESEKLMFYKEKLLSIYKLSKDDAMQKQKLYTGVGFFVGALAGIILL